jgi:transposase InsO family protein
VRPTFWLGDFGRVFGLGLAFAFAFAWREVDADAREKLEAWRVDYNLNRPHRSIGNLTPTEFAQRCQGNRTA